MGVRMNSIRRNPRLGAKVEQFAGKKRQLASKNRRVTNPARAG